MAMKAINAKPFRWLAVCLLVTAIAWALTSIIGYGMTFSRTEFDGLKKGMSRADAMAELKKIGVVELEAIPDNAPNVSKDADTQEGLWVRLNEKDYVSKIYRYDTWRYQVPNSYSNVDITFRQDGLVSIKYRWRPFEG
ncbi:hypothetical protein DVJ77_02115 [Dyella tabacisoli]|uniref:Uncharacterized protein n=1 Tax=Dyella tabacisoli TaxID=2282381 RepID=A0A369UUW7_9GAMM|nr:hypothetical protein DVJ77_02115 [Dyella tabacisoli]